MKTTVKKSPIGYLLQFLVLLAATALLGCESTSSAGSRQHGSNPNPAMTEESVLARFEDSESRALRASIIKLVGVSGAWQKLEPFRNPFNDLYTVRPGGAMKVRYDPQSDRLYFKGSARITETCPGRRNTWVWTYDGDLAADEFTPEDNGSFICRSPVPPVYKAFSISNKWVSDSGDNAEIVFIVITSSGFRLVSDDTFVMFLEPK